MNSPAHSPRLCPTCGSSIPENAPAGLCPQCLLNAGLESAAATNPELAATQQSPSSGGFLPPEIAELTTKFPQLEILELLGKGGMGAVYKARQRGLDRLVAIKILPPEIGNDPAFAERFAREARALGRLNHPNIVSVYDFGHAGGLYYFLMEFVEGANLRQAIRSGGLTAKDALAIVSQVCDALQFAHDEGVVHRDIKPENILIDKRGRVKIADFGLAKLLGQEQADHALTETHQVMGTLRYMAPEQMQGSKEVDHRADIFSLGVVFYELLTGELPVGRFAPPSKTVGVDVRLDEVVLRALEREPTLRYQHVSEVKTEVQAISGLSPQAVQNLFGREYRSKAEIFGWPLLHIAFGIDAKTGKRKVAQGVIAIGDTAVGGLAIGGGAYGVIACGGLAAGVISFGGVSIGLLLAIGGCALGNLAFGGLAIGTVAVGGCAVGYYAFGGSVFGAFTVSGAHQNPEALKLFENLSISRDWPRWLMWIGLASPAAFGLLYVFIWLVFWSQPDKDSASAISKKHDPAIPPATPSQPTRPWMTIVFAIFNLCVAAVLLLMVALPEPDFWNSEYVRGWEAWLYLRNTLSFGHATALLLSALGLVLWQPWGRRATIAVAVFAVVVLVIELPFMARIELPYETNSLQAQMIADGMKPSDAEVASVFTMAAIVGGALFLGLVMIVAQLIYFTRPHVVAAFETETPSKPVDVRQQIKQVGSGLIAIGIAMILCWIPMMIAVSIWASKSNAEWLIPVMAFSSLYSWVGGALVIRGGQLLVRCESLGFGQFAVILSMIPLTLMALIGIPFGLWAWGVLNRREATLVAEEEERWREKKELTRRQSLRDQESVWHDLGVIVGYFLRNQTTRWIIGATASLVYLMCLIMFFSFHGERVTLDDVPVQRYSAGQPGPWLFVEASSRGHRMSVQLICWANLIALIGILALQVARQIEKLRTGKMHSMVWHYVTWCLMMAVVVGLGMSNLYIPLPKSTNHASKAAPQAAPTAAQKADAKLALPEARTD